MSFLRTHQKEILSAVLGAALAGVVSMGTGMYSLTKSFEYTQNKEQLSGLRKDIEFLSRVRNEIDINTQSLLASDYRILVKFGPPIDLFGLMAKNSDKGKEKASPEQLQMLKQMMGGQAVPIVELRAPREKLVVESWASTFPESGDIPFELLTEISDYYRRVRRINIGVERMDQFSPGTAIAEGFSQVLQKDATHHNLQVDDLTKIDAVKLKNKISEQIQQLSERRKRISAGAGAS